jgi:PAS domain S-box-containing protein
MALNAAIKDDEREALLRRYRAMAEEGSDIIFFLEGGRIVFATSALGRLLGRSIEDFQDGGYLSLVHPDDMAEALTVRGTPAPAEIRSATYRVRHAAGHYLWFETRTRGVYDEKTGVFLHEVAVGRDVTERKENELRLSAAQDRAEAANRAKSAFLANMSHELRTPLNAVLGFADIMQNELFGPVGDARYRDYILAIREAGERLLGMVSNILDVAKMESGRLSVHPEQLDLDLIVSEAIGLISPEAARKNVRLEHALEAKTVCADRVALQKILANLLSNAVRFTPAGGCVRVESAFVDENWGLRVRDNGLGMGAPQLARLALPFEQLCSQAALARNGSGAGVGLALVRALTEAHGGRLHIESTPGRGTLVSLTFPHRR